MPRRSRFATGGYVFHVLNRAVGRQTIFARDADYAAFLNVLDEVRRQVAVRILCYCIMPNHWHLVLWPTGDDDLSAFMQRLTTTHTRRWHKVHETVGNGPLYQGRFKSFPVETDDHYYTVCRYVERNPLRANLVQHAEAWRWSSLWQWRNDRCDVALAPWPLPRFSSWLDYVQTVQSEAELAALRASLTRGSPFGNDQWRVETASQLGLEKTLHPRGRPSK